MGFLVSSSILVWFWDKMDVRLKLRIPNWRNFCKSSSLSVFYGTWFCEEIGFWFLGLCSSFRRFWFWRVLEENMFWSNRVREIEEQNGGPPCGQVRVLVVGDSGLWFCLNPFLSPLFLLFLLILIGFNMVWCWFRNFSMLRLNELMESKDGKKNSKGALRLKPQFAWLRQLMTMYALLELTVFFLFLLLSHRTKHPTAVTFLVCLVPWILRCLSGTNVCNYFVIERVKWYIQSILGSSQSFVQKVELF